MLPEIMSVRRLLVAVLAPPLIVAGASSPGAPAPPAEAAALPAEAAAPPAEDAAPPAEAAAASHPDSASGPGAPARTAAAHVQTTTTRLERLAEKVIETGTPGVALATITGDGATTAIARGVADRRTNRPARPDDRYRIGSITKTMTAVVVLQLVAEGKIGLDDRVVRWMPGLGLDERITVRHLLQHTSGFHTDTMLASPPWSYDRNRFHYFSYRDLVRIALTNPEPRRTPGTHHEYSNTNYVLAGMLIEEVTARPVGVEFARRIFGPLGMRDTSYPVANPVIAGRHLRGYLQDGPDKPLYDTTTYSMSWLRTAGGVVSTTRDELTFLRALFSGRLLPKPLFDEMRNVGEFGYGLGIYPVEVPCVPGGVAWGHNGQVFGYYSAVFTTPDGSRQAAVGANAWIMTEDGTLNPTAEQVAAAALCD
ncbi:serine hydrolase domain-containing protein [Actinopolymorpha sp. B9G3]|uniref:serine hydrolase domain-containing protein n=1 Tax=Actinopolymorpha sp. B9G3 TaxID=3158970 RepID=UPI0032D8F8E4